MAKAKRESRADAKRMLIKKNFAEPESSTKLSLPVISNEKLYNGDDYTFGMGQNGETGENPPMFEISEVKISCAALNYEKIIDLKNNNVTAKDSRKPKQAPRKKAGGSVKNKAGCNKNCTEPIKNSLQKNVKKPSQKKFLISSKKELQTLKVTVRNPKPLTKMSSLKENNKILIKAETQTCERKSLCYNTTCTTQPTNKENDSQTSISGNPNGQANSNLNAEALNTQDISCSSFHLQDDECALTELNDINLKELLPNLHTIPDDSSGMKECSGKNENLDDDATVHLQKPNGSVDSRTKNFADLDNASNDVSSLRKNSLQTAVENFLNNPQLKYLKGSTALKRGLCSSWLSNNYVCSNKHCLYNHNALGLFVKKLKKYPSKFIMTVVVSMRHDHLFVDVALAAFKVVIERQIPVVWVTFLAFFVFYVTEPSDSRFLKFWANVARFFCELQKNYSATVGFASLISIFSQIENGEKWKIIEFIKLIKQPPVQLHVSFTVLQPILKMDLPSEFLTEAVETCIATKKDVLKVYSLIVPKIPIMTSPIGIVESLLTLCHILENKKRKDLADDLKERLRAKVWSVKTKIPEQKYPLTAAFQEEIRVNSNEEHCLVNSVSNCKEASEVDLSFLGSENNYFQPEEDFCNIMAQVMEFPTDAIPKPNKNTDDVSQRQITRIKQLFRDYQFDVLGKYLNEVRPNVTEQIAEEFLKLLFRMKISLQQGVDLVKIILLHCKSECATKVVASISTTLIFNLVRINEWEKAYAIVYLCQEKRINLVEGKVFYVSAPNAVTQCRIALLLIEIHAYKGNYGKSVELVKKYCLYSANNSLWEMTWEARDETIRIKIMEDLLQQIISSQLSQEANDLFALIWNEQKQLTEPVDLRKFVSEILILLLNKSDEEALNLYEQIKTEGVLNDNAIRAVVITLVRRNSLSAAKNLVLSVGQNSYFTPKITQNSATVTVLSFWLEEEIYVIFDAFFDLLTSNKTVLNHNNVEIQLRESTPHLTSSSGLRPLCLGIITSTLRDACNRIQRVLQYQFNPPLKLIIMPYYLKLDESSLRLHLQKRMKI